MRSDPRYARQVRFPSIGVSGQERLGSARVLLVGVGALGSALAETLVRSGVGRMWLVDRDVVELSNLQRQTLYAECDVGAPKAHAAAARLHAINRTAALAPIAEDFTPAVFEGLDAAPDLILDGTDNFATRYLINDLALRARVPWVYGGAVGSRGTAMAVLPGRTPCLRCLMPEPPPGGATETCETAGVLAPAIAAVAAFQATQALKILSGNTDAVTRGFLMLDVWDHQHRLHMTDAGPAPHCATCQGESFPALDADWLEPVRLCGRDAIQVQPRTHSGVDLDSLAARLDTTDNEVVRTPWLLRFRAEGHAFSVFPNGRALVFGLDDCGRARILYDRYVGA